MKIDGESTTKALMDWYRGYVARYPGLDLDLGKFYFSISTGTIGAFVAFEKIDTTSSISTLLLTSFLFLAISIVISFILILPFRINIDQNPNIVIIYEKVSKRINKVTILWFITWFIGSFIGVINSILM